MGVKRRDQIRSTCIAFYSRPVGNQKHPKMPQLQSVSRLLLSPHFYKKKTNTITKRTGGHSTNISGVWDDGVKTYRVPLFDVVVTVGHEFVGQLRDVDEAVHLYVLGWLSV